MHCFRGRLGLKPGCEKQEFKKVLKKARDAIKKYVPGAGKLFAKFEKEKGPESREFWERAAETEM